MTAKTPMSRRAAITAAAGVFSGWALAAESSDVFRFGVIADTHIIDDFYHKPEPSNPDQSIVMTSERLQTARAFLNQLKPGLDRVFVVGDYFHDYPSPDMDFYFKHQTRIDNAKALTDGFVMPVHIGFGNHDYHVPEVSRDFSHELFRRKLGVKPYYSIDHKGWKFIHLNTFLGNTWRVGHREYDQAKGSFEEEQLNWLEAQFEQLQPSFVFVHYPLQINIPTERADFGIYSLLKKHRDSVQLVVSGHWHKWFDFGLTYGPQHLVMSATRFDANAYLIVEVDRKRVQHRLLNIGLVDWNTHYSKPYGG